MRRGGGLYASPPRACARPAEGPADRRSDDVRALHIACRMFQPLGDVRRHITVSADAPDWGARAETRFEGAPHPASAAAVARPSSAWLVYGARMSRNVGPQPGSRPASFLGRASVDLRVIPSRVATGASFDISVRNRTPLTLTTDRPYRLQRNTGSWTDVALPENWMWTLEQIGVPARQVWIQQARLSRQRSAGRSSHRQGAPPRRSDSNPGRNCDVRGLRCWPPIGSP